MKYIAALKKLLRTAGIFEKMEVLGLEFRNLPSDEMLKHWTKEQIYYNTTSELMLSAENKLKPKFANLVTSSEAERSSPHLLQCQSAS